MSLDARIPQSSRRSTLPIDGVDAHRIHCREEHDTTIHHRSMMLNLVDDAQQENRNGNFSPIRRHDMKSLREPVELGRLNSLVIR